jgi:hypothetical protein
MGANKCCDTYESCFVGDLSGLSQDFFYFEDVSVLSEESTQFQAGSSLHMHIFYHNVHFLSNYMHLHVVSVNGDLFLARSLTESRTCECARGDFDCICQNMDDGLHAHFFVHEHPNATQNHTHNIEVRSPAIGVPANQARNSSVFMTYPTIPIYGVGHIDTIPSSAFKSISDITSLEDSIIPFNGTEILLDRPLNISNGSTVTIVLGGDSIKLPSTVGGTGIYSIKVADASGTSNKCQRSPQYCPRLLSRAVATSVSISNAIFVSAEIQLSKPFAGSVSNVTLHFVNSIDYPRGSVLVLGFPDFVQPILPLTIWRCDSQSENCYESGTNEHRILTHEQILDCPVTFTCVGVMYHYGLAKFREEKYILSSFLMPEQEVKVNHPFFLAVFDGNSIVELPADSLLFPIVKPVLMLNCTGTLSTLIAGSLSNATIHFTLENDAGPGHIFAVQFPATFDLQSAEIQLVWSSKDSESSIGSLLDTQIFKNVTLLLMTLPPNTSVLNKGAQVTIMFRGLRNAYGSGQNLSFTIFTMTRAQGTISQCSFNVGPFLPAIITSAKASLSSLRTGAQTKLNVSFTTPIPIVQESEIIITLPTGFALCSNQGALSTEFFQVNYGNQCSTSICRQPSSANCSVPRCDPALSVSAQDSVSVRFNSDCSVIPANSEISFRISSIRNMLVEGPSGELKIYTSSPSCSICSYAQNIDWQQGLRDAYLETSTLADSAIALTATGTGAPSNITASFMTINYLPVDSWIVIDLPQYSQFNRSLWNLRWSSWNSSSPSGTVSSRTITSSTCCGMTAIPDVSFTCCSYSQLIFFKLPSSVAAGTSFQIQISGISNMLSAGVATFQIRTASALWRFVDRVQLNVSIASTQINASVTPISYSSLLPNGTMLSVLSTQLVLGAQGSFVVNLKIANMIPASGGLQVEFSPGFDLRQAKLLGAVQGLNGNFTSQGISNVIVINRYNGTDALQGSILNFTLINVAHPRALGAAFFRVKTLVQIGSPSCTTCAAFLIDSCDVCNNYGTVDDSGVIVGSFVNTGQLNKLSALIAPVESIWLYFGAAASINVSFILGSAQSTVARFMIDPPSNFTSVVPLNVQTLSGVATYNVFPNNSILLTLPIGQGYPPVGSTFWIFISGLLCPSFSVNTLAVNVQTISNICSESTCALEAGRAQATSLVSDFENGRLSTTFSQVFASVSAIAAGPTKNVSFGVTLVWSSKRSGSGQITSNFSSSWSYSVTSTISGRFNVDPDLLKSLKGSTISFSMTANAGSLSLGIANVIVQGTPSSPLNVSVTNSNSSTLIVTWTAPADQGVGTGQEYFLTSYVIDIWRESDLNALSSLRSLTVRCCSGTRSCCGINSVVLSDARECIMVNNATSCISTDFSGQNISLRLRAFNAAGGGNFSSNLSTFVIGAASSLYVSANAATGMPNGSAGIIIGWSAPTVDYDFGLGPGVSTPGLTYQFEVQGRSNVHNSNWSSSVLVQPSIFQFCFCRELEVGQNYSFSVRMIVNISGFIYPGKWSSAMVLQAIPRPSIASIVSIDSKTGCSARFGMNITQISGVSATNMILGFYVIQRVAASFQPCCTSGNLCVQCTPYDLASLNTSYQIFQVSFSAGTLSSFQSLPPAQYTFEVNSSVRGVAYQYQVLGYNTAGNASYWSDLSQAVQCQSSPLPAIQISPPAVSDSSASIKWGPVSFPLNYTQDFVYEVTLAENPSYPFGGYFREGQANDQINIPTSLVLASDSSSLQSLRTFGARDIDFAEVGGIIYLAVANAKAYADSNSDLASLINLATGRTMLEASMIFVWNDTSKSFGGDCQWRPSATLDCLSIGPLCASFARNPTCLADTTFTQNKVLLPNTGAQQFIQTFGALTTKFMVLDGIQYLFVLNSMVPAPSSTFYCFDSATSFPVKVVSNPPGLEPKNIISSLTTCQGRSDVVTCGTGVCRPAAFQDRVLSSHPNSTGSFSVLYKLDPGQRLFLEHSTYSFQKPTALEFFSALSCVPANGCHLVTPLDPSCPVCTNPSSDCICTDTSFMGITDELGPSLVMYWNSTQQLFVELQGIQTSGAKSARFFQTLDESILVIANGYNNSGSNLTTEANSFVYRLENGLFQYRSSFVTNGANHIESFEKDGRYYLVVCNGMDSSSNISSPCTPNGTCPMIYEWTAGNLRFVQSLDDFAMNQAVSSTAFSRIENDKRVQYLLFANNGTSSTKGGGLSYLYRWTTTLNVWGSGDILFDGFALVRKIHTSGARNWNVYQNRGLTFAAVANEMSFDIDTFNPNCRQSCLQTGGSQCTPNNPSGCIQQSCNYRVAGSCCETAGSPCIVSTAGNSLSYYLYTGSFSSRPRPGVSSIYYLSSWPVFTTKIFEVCTNTSIQLQLQQSTPLQSDFRFYGAGSLVTVRALNQVAVGPPTQIEVRSLRTPGPPASLAALQRGPASILLLFSPPDNDGEIPKKGRTSVIMGYRALVIENVGQESLSPVCTAPYCVYDTYTTTLNFTATVLKKGSNYSFFVFAINAAGQGVASQEVSAIAFVSPSPVRNLSAQPTLGPLRVKISWSIPADLGSGPGKPLQGYMSLYYKISIYRADGYVSSPVLVYTQEASNMQNEQTMNLPDDLHRPKFSFKKGAIYYFYVSAQTVAGQSTPVKSSACALTRSDPPILLSALVTGHAQITLSWRAPSDIGSGPGKYCGSDISQNRIREEKILLYVVEVSRNEEFVPLVVIEGSNLTRCYSNSTSFTIRNLDIGRKYFFRVFIETVPGTSLPSNALSTFVIGIPALPRNARILQTSPLSLSILCTLPENTGLGPSNQAFKLSSVQVDVSEDTSFAAYSGYSMSQDKSQANITLTGLKAGTKYFFRIKAVNLAGPSPYTPVFSGIPLDVPAAPELVKVQTKNGFVLDLSWQVTY